MDNQLLSTRPKNQFGFIYCYTSPSGKKYIGQTKTTLKERAKSNGKGYKGCKYFYKAIQKYGFENFSVEILAEVPLDIINEEEKSYIFLYNTTDRNKGYNIDDGGTNSIFNTLNSIPIYQYCSKDGKFIKEYPSIAQAARENNVYHTGIRKALNNSNKKSANSYWTTEKKEKIEISKEYNSQPHAKTIYQYDSTTGKLIEEFNSIREASRITGISRPTIQSHISGKVQKGKIYTFKDFKVDNLYSESSTTIS